MSEILGAGRTCSARLPAAGLCQQWLKDEPLSLCASRWTQSLTEQGPEPCLFAEMNKAINGWPIKTRLVHKPIRQRLHEENERVLFCIRQTQTTNFARVHIGGRLRRWPAGRTFTRIMGLAAL